MVLKLLEDTFVTQKIGSVHFSLCLKQKSPPGRGELSISSKQRFLKIFFPLAETGEGYGDDKMTKIKLARILVKGFNKFNHVYNISIFSFCYVVHNLDSSMLKCEDSFTELITFSQKSIVCTKNYMKYKTLPYPVF